jgi:hypothetical protein
MRVRCALGCIVVGSILSTSGCIKRSPKPEYGLEGVLLAPRHGPGSVAVAPVINLSGESSIDPLLAADVVFRQLGQVEGWTAVPVNRVAEVYLALNIPQVESTEQADLVCDVLGVDALLVPTLTLYDPYDPPSVGASLVLFVRNAGRSSRTHLDARELAHRPFWATRRA